ncbi:hypothetical protein WN55_10621 [Dufourea novaeangliae]|uniref:Uncharacterized protein n=1 Tax=Dufourea novaeangliae TaxID=178035 RepID=A0A154P4C7_DUFNO|nr:hypothetical protein WN55_10621 [Dufourea novaeangliae]
MFHGRMRRRHSPLLQLDFCSTTFFNRLGATPRTGYHIANTTRGQLVLSFESNWTTQIVHERNRIEGAAQTPSLDSLRIEHHPRGNDRSTPDYQTIDSPMSLRRSG